MDAERTDFPAGTFDRALSLCVMEHLGDDERVMRNVFHALKPGGRFAFSADSLSRSGITPEERERHRPRYAVNTFYTPEVARRKLDRAGFDVEASGFVIDSPVDLRLVRLSRGLDRSPASSSPRAFSVTCFLGAVSGRVPRHAAGRRPRRAG